MFSYFQVWAEIGKGFLDGSLDKSANRKKQYEDGKFCHS